MGQTLRRPSLYRVRGRLLAAPRPPARPGLSFPMASRFEVAARAWPAWDRSRAPLAAQGPAGAAPVAQAPVAVRAGRPRRAREVPSGPLTVPEAWAPLHFPPALPLPTRPRTGRPQRPGQPRRQPAVRAPIRSSRPGSCPFPRRDLIPSNDFRFPDRCTDWLDGVQVRTIRSVKGATHSVLSTVPARGLGPFLREMRDGLVWGAGLEKEEPEFNRCQKAIDLACMVSASPRAANTFAPASR